MQEFRYPVGIQSFSEIRKYGYLYVDKTDQIYALTHHVKYHFLSRPRRFGKSLLISTIEAYFKGKRELFEGLALSKLEKEWLEYPVLHLDLTGANYHEPESLHDKLNDALMKKELHHFFKQDIHELSEYMQISDDEMLARLKKKYDGYHFVLNSEGVYNPFSLLKAFYNQKLENYWFASGTPTFLAELSRQQRVLLEDLYNCRRTEDQLKEIDSYQRDAIPLFYQCGYLTINGPEDRFGKLLLGFPNDEVEIGMTDFFVPFYCKVRATSEFDISLFVNDVENGRINDFMTRIASLLADTTYEIEHDLEVHFQNFFYLLFKLMGYYVQAEYHTSAGRIDLTVKTDKYIYIIEFKIARSAKMALNQIIKNHYADPFMSDPRKKYLVGANFSTKLRGMGKFVVQEIGSLRAE